MKNLFLLLVLGISFTSCNKGDTIAPEEDLSTSFKLNITKLNSSDTNTYPIVLKEYTSKYSDWYANGAGGVSLEKSITFTTALPTGETLKLEMWLQDDESAQLLTLNENAVQVDHYKPHKDWDYISYNDEVTKFYTNKIRNRRLMINNRNVLFGEDGTFDIIKTSAVQVNGETKTRVTIKLKGDLYPFYSNWSSPDAATYRVEGEFSGIIE